jgi:hypothetical protein
MDERIAWVLNLDAELELAQGSGRTRDRATEARIGSLASRLGGLVGSDDLIVWPGTPPSSAEGLWGRAWCPTPDALARLAAAGARSPRRPSFDVLRAVNDRRFSAALGGSLPGACFAEEASAVFDAMGSSSADETWLLKRAFGFAGQKRRRVSMRAIDDADRRWIARSFERGGGLQVEPFVERLLDAGLHGYLDDRGALVLGRPTIQEVDAHGAWRSTRIDEEGALDAQEVQALEDEARKTAEALVRRGYFGAFGIDAFRYRVGSEIRFRPRCEINARYSMGWAIGMSGHRPPGGLP